MFDKGFQKSNLEGCSSATKCTLAVPYTLVGGKLWSFVNQKNEK